MVEKRFEFGKSSIKADKFVTASHRYHSKHAHLASLA